MKIRYNSLLISMALLISAAALNANPQPSGCCISILSAPVTISHPGTYRLATDVTGDITIAASNVELNLDNRKITAGTNGVSVTMQSDVLIRNGIIEGGMNGISTVTCENIAISDVDFIANLTGINVLTVTGITVDNCNFRELVNGDGLCIENTNNGKFINLAMYHNNFTFGVFITNSFDLLFENVSVNNNTTEAGFFMDDVNNSNFRQCLANSNNETDFFVFGGRSSNCIFEECQANGNFSTRNGISSAFFANLNSNNLKFIRCTANHNQEVSNGFFNFECDDVLYDHCCSNSNIHSERNVFGFLALDGNKTIFESCIANDNFVENTDDASIGLALLGETNSCVLNCVAKRNSSAGISLDGCVNCFVKENVTIDNGLLGINIDETPLTTGVFSNYSAGHGVFFNYTISAGFDKILIATYDPASAPPSGPLLTLNTTDTISKWHNISFPT